jgi:predicted transcriptional regulator
MKFQEYVSKGLGQKCGPKVRADGAEILEYIRAHPGCKTFDIELECRVSRATADYHLRKLRKSGQVQNGWWPL